MSPLCLNILLHYHTSPTDYHDGDFRAPAVQDAINWLAEDAELLEINDERIAAGFPAYRLSEKGHFFVGKLCSLQVPVATWAMREGE